MKISKTEIENLKFSLNYFHMQELRDLCLNFNLPKSGQKVELLNNIISYIESGQIPPKKQLPDISKAQKGKEYLLNKKTLILLGAYKNDLKTRLFMKQLVGEYFHFTAFGQDWMKERWYSKNPPTYAEFAAYWRAEYLRRKKNKAQPKGEWAYINFIQSYVKEHPHASKQEILRNWESMRKKHLLIAQEILKVHDKFSKPAS